MQNIQRMQELRELKELKQKDIAEQLNITQQQYSLYEKGTRELKLDVLIKLAQFYECTTDYLLGISNIKNPYKE